MNSAEWESCEDLERMLGFLGAALSPRKRRLFACRCYDLADPNQKDEQLQESLRFLEQFADGLVTRDQAVAHWESKHCVSLFASAADPWGDLDYYVMSRKPAEFAASRVAKIALSCSAAAHDAATDFAHVQWKDKYGDVAEHHYRAASEACDDPAYRIDHDRDQRGAWQHMRRYMDWEKTRNDSRFDWNYLYEIKWHTTFENKWKSHGWHTTWPCYFARLCDADASLEWVRDEAVDVGAEEGWNCDPAFAGCRADASYNLPPWVNWLESFEDAAPSVEAALHPSILRFIVGNPIEPLNAPPTWPARVVEVASALYERGDCAEKLSNALYIAGDPYRSFAKLFQEGRVAAGAQQLGNNLRFRKNWRGFHALDLILGKH